MVVLMMRNRLGKLERDAIFYGGARCGVAVCRAVCQAVRPWRSGFELTPRSIHYFLQLYTFGQFPTTTMSPPVYIVSAARTPVGMFQGQVNHRQCFSSNIQ